MLAIPKSLSDFLSVSHNLVIITHYNPDGDAIGSSMGLYNALIQKGHTVQVIVPNEQPPFLQWMSGCCEILNFTDKKDKCLERLNQAEMVFCLDFNATSRIDKLEEHIKTLCCPTVMLDHHPYPSNFATYNISDIDKSSTCELVFDFLDALGWNDVINKTVAECLLTGIMTDTGCFVHNASNPRTYEVMAELVRTGADKNDIYNRVFDNYSFDRMKLLGYCLNEKLVYLPQYHVAYMSLTRDEQNKFNMQTGDTEGIVNIPFSIKGIWITAFFSEKNDKIRISFRSKGSFAVNKFSELYFEGGGHHNAAGGESKLTMPETLARFEQLIQNHAHEITEPYNE